MSAVMRFRLSSGGSQVGFVSMVWIWLGWVGTYMMTLHHIIIANGAFGSGLIKESILPDCIVFVHVVR